ncbi:uncharacterized protein TEOVI_000250400 [Trypanosoma equiperdum]|uniref:J domain-containing protein n=4 Tax=Trypanozoon TaxID=39700 RepID=Q57YN2_TRYB2|nr:hypothetical protein, conserved [Trypanosoma brucei gambiense DAL972]XP_847461.1 hypothetical protein, conserved [Trypanosoma brucei brucei TREU927]AAX69309.1 hypothetical protein, conserved [Trypanosoma brucei]RHW73069.1 hypothetical protein DPX39_040054400 [Trypanosoma brucei equiperdum]SCU70929.1 hypothetical protein, conserved [Trypanosoma equiperdum]AAZ13395.1 hypothetical protein, conserved [Trypanosoma brucei brucei TREU927]CBH13699.1 hypothetical protein, conserved [Trypanosoma bru|eukprot:XP_011775975.1 hypothetical protein, conserved [Trypanosoma brucei gambiense DAL972]
MAAPLAALVLLGGAYYIFRLAPRITQRVSMAQGLTCAANRQLRPYRRYEGGFEKSMTKREALLLLGFTEDVASGGFLSLPSDEEIKTRYYGLMKQLHSDVDGSPYIAAKLNEARDILGKK